MPRSRPIQTPLGAFASAAQAARAHHCDRSTVLSRLQTDPEHYHWIDTAVAAPRVSMASDQGWQYYYSLDHDQRDAWYESWCRSAGFDPNSEDGGNAFFDALDAVDSAEVQS